MSANPDEEGDDLSEEAPSFADVSADDVEEAPREEPDLQTQIGGVVEALQKRPGDGSTYVFLFNTGAYATLIGQGGRDINVGVAQGTSGLSEAKTGQSIDAWYSTCAKGNDERDASLIAAIAFLVNGSERRVFDAAGQLHRRLGHTGRTLANTITGSLERIGAVREPTPALTREREFEGLVLAPPERNAEIRQYLWTQVVGADQLYAEWLAELGTSGEVEVAGRVGIGVGALAGDLFRANEAARLRTLFTKTIDAWALSGGHARNALGQALCTAGAHDGAHSYIKRWIDNWIEYRGPRTDNRDDIVRAVNVCRSSWAAFDTDHVMEVLRQIEPRVQLPNLFKGSQEAINQLWVGASLLRSDRRDTAEKIARALASWSTKKKRSVHYRMPQTRLALAVQRELRETKQIPLLLESAASDRVLASVAAPLFAKGILRPESATKVNEVLAQLGDHSRANGYTEAFDQFAIMVESARMLLLAEDAPPPAPQAPVEPPPPVATSPPPPLPPAPSGPRPAPRTNSERSLDFVDDASRIDSSGRKRRPQPSTAIWTSVLVIFLAVVGAFALNDQLRARAFGIVERVQNRLGLAPEREANAWEIASTRPRLQRLRQFIIDYPRSEHTGDALALARSRIAELRVQPGGQTVLIARDTPLRHLPTFDLTPSDFAEAGAATVIDVISSEGSDWLVIEVSDAQWPYRFVPPNEPTLQ